MLPRAVAAATSSAARRHAPRLLFAAARSSGPPLRHLSDVAAAGTAPQPLRDVAVRSASGMGCIADVEVAVGKFGRFSTNEKAWMGVTATLLEEGGVELRTMSPVDLMRLLRLLIDQARVTRQSFWADFTEQIRPVLQAAKFTDLLEISEMYARIQAWERPVFEQTMDSIRHFDADPSVHTMAPADLVRLLGIFSRAGTGSKELSGMATRLFNTAEERILEEVDDLSFDDCASLLSSMARFRFVKDAMLQHLGREKLHAPLKSGELHGPRAVEILNAYGELGVRHDTVFRVVLEEVLQEHGNLQRARVLGEDLPSVKYSTADITMVAFALLRLKMYRGNTTWFKWGDRYQELVDCLNKRMESQAELDTLGAEALASGAFVLGRARRGSEKLVKTMFARMMQLLEGSGDAESLPQDHLERFMHGLAMMGPDRKKSLSADWLMQWLCSNVYTFVISDFIRINRHLVMMGCCEKEYLQMLVPFYCRPEQMKGLRKSDIMELTNTYNGARIREDDIPDGLGRHFFWAMGRQYQNLQAGPRARRAPYKRVG